MTRLWARKFQRSASNKFLFSVGSGKKFGYCMSNTASAKTSGCAHISRHCAVRRTKPVLQHQAVHTSHDTVMYVEHSQCYSNTRLSTHLTTLCCISNTASATEKPGCAHISRHCDVCRTQPVLQQHQVVHTSHDTVL